MTKLQSQAMYCLMQLYPKTSSVTSIRTNL